MSAEKILVIEDDKHISQLVKYNLEKAGFGCTSTITAEEGLEITDKYSFDLIIADLMLPKMDGFQFCKLLRQNQKKAHIPIIFLTARGEEVDRIVGLELGAEDYIVKPFSPRELVLRVKAILRRRGAKEVQPKDILHIGSLEIDIPRHKVTVDQKSVELSPMGFKLLVLLMQRKGRVQSREILLNDVWGIAADVTTRTVDTHVKLLRQKLGKSAGKMIQTIRGLGYKIQEEDEMD